MFVLCCFKIDVDSQCMETFTQEALVIVTTLLINHFAVFRVGLRPVAYSRASRKCFCFHVKGLGNVLK